MLEYLCFDFRPFGMDKNAVRLEIFCNVISHPLRNYRFKFLMISVKICLFCTVCNGIAHRDLKPWNILVTKQHYAGIVDDADRVKEIFHDVPVRAKLVDFGECKS